MSNKNITEKARVLEWFAESGCPYFAIHITKTDRVCWNDSISDFEEATDKLSKFLEKGEAGKYTLYVYAKQKQAAPTGTMKFYFEYSSFEKDEYYTSKNMGQMVLLEELRALRNEVSELRMSRAMAESEDDEEIEEKAEPTNYIGAILGNPAIQQILANFLTNITANLATPHITAMNQNKPVAMAGVIADDLENILSILESKGITKNDLRLLSELPQEKINLFLPMLRNGL